MKKLGMIMETMGFGLLGYGFTQVPWPSQVLAGIGSFCLIAALTIAKRHDWR
jgi:hypothetical protein